MKTKRGFLMFTMGAMFIWSCGNDDSGPAIEPPRDLVDVIAEEGPAIEAFLETHFYNYEAFENPPADFDFQIVIDTIAGENADKISLMDMPNKGEKTLRVSSADLAIRTEEEAIAHTLYYWKVRPGNPSKPLTVADSVFVRYEGSLINGNVFDSNTLSPIWFDLARLQGPLQGARGFSEGIAELEAGGPPIINDDGTYSVPDYGIGLIIFPSGLGYYNIRQGAIPPYSPLIFKVDALAVSQVDHDRDGIPSIDEDIDGDGYLYDDNTDLTLEVEANAQTRLPNFLDPDDDGDGTPTRDEISDADGNIILPYPDADGDGTPDYLDPDTN